VIASAVWLMASASRGAAVVPVDQQRSHAPRGLRIAQGVVVTLLAFGVGVAAIYTFAYGRRLIEIEKYSDFWPPHHWLWYAAGAAVVLAFVPRKRGSIGVPVGAALLTASACGVGLWIAMPHIERQHRGNMNLAFSAEQVRMVTRQPMIDAAAGLKAHLTPQGPVIISDEGLFPMLLMHLQYAMDGDFYCTDSFFPRIAGGFGLMGIGQKAQSDHDKDSPLLLQPQRVEYMSKIMKGKTAADMLKAQHHMIDEAIADHRCVFGVVTPMQESEFRKRFKEAPYEVVELGRWNEPCSVKTDEDPRHHSPLAPVNSFGEPIIRWRPQALILLQVKHKAPSTQPTTQPSEPVTPAPTTAQRDI
jgi:hypothetical protein